MESALILRKSMAVNSWETPQKMLNKFRVFLDFAIITENLLNGFAKIAAPLNKSYKKEHCFQMDASTNKTPSNALKKALTEAPVL